MEENTYFFRKKVTLLFSSSKVKEKKEKNSDYWPCENFHTLVWKLYICVLDWKAELQDRQKIIYLDDTISDWS